MKKTFLLSIFLLLLAPLKSTAQIYAEGKNINDSLSWQYINIAISDFKGNEYSVFNNQGSFKLTDSIGKKLVFDKKNADTIYNYMYKNGWELVSENAVKKIFKRRKD